MALSEDECSRNAFRASPSCPLEVDRKTDVSAISGRRCSSKTAKSMVFQMTYFVHSLFFRNFANRLAKLLHLGIKQGTGFFSSCR